MTEKQRKDMWIDPSRFDTPLQIEAHEERDEYGVYSTGVFSSNGNAFAVVTYMGGMWHLAIHSKTPLGLVQLKAFRRTFIPQKARMALFIPSSIEEDFKNTIYLYEISDGKKEK